MQSVVREAMEEGAWGISTGLDYPPGSYASTDELIAISKTANELGGLPYSHAGKFEVSRNFGSLGGSNRNWQKKRYPNTFNSLSTKFSWRWKSFRLFRAS